MKRRFSLCICFIVVFLKVCESRFILKKLEQCKEYMDIPIRLETEIINDASNENLINTNTTLDIPLTSDISLHGKVEVLTFNEWRPLFDLNEKNMCNAMHKLIGELMYDVERTLQLQPGICPIPQGYYRLRKYAVNMNLMTVHVVLPKSSLRSKVIGKQNKEVVVCVDLLVENV